MKTVLLILCLCISLFSGSWDAIQAQKFILKKFKNVQIVEVINGIPDNLRDARYHVICTTDAELDHWQYRKKGTTFVYTYGHKIKVHEDGMAIIDLSFDTVIKTTQSDPSAGTDRFVSYFFLCTDNDDNGEGIIARLAFCRSVLMGRAFFTMYKATDISDWLTFRVE